MRVIRKLIALVVYGALFLPGGDNFRLHSWMRAVEITSTAFDATLRRRRSRLESERFTRHLRVLRLENQHEERTLRVRLI